MTNIKTITQNQLPEFFRKIKRAMPVSITYFVDESGSRVEKGKKLLQKSVTTTVFINGDYETMVNRRLSEQGLPADFRAEMMSGKTRTWSDCRSIVENKSGEKMLHYCAFYHNKPETQYFFQGEPISKQEAIEKGLFQDSYFTPKKTVGRGQVSDDNDFVQHDLLLKNLKRFVLNKVEYIVL